MSLNSKKTAESEGEIVSLSIFLNSIVLSFLINFLIIVPFCLAGDQGLGQVLGKFLGETLSNSMSKETENTQERDTGKIQFVRVLEEDHNGCLLEVVYRDVEFPEGIVLVAEAYTASSFDPIFVTSAFPISTRNGSLQIPFSYRFQRRSKTIRAPHISSISVKLYRENNPEIIIAQSSVDPVSHSSKSWGDAASTDSSSSLSNQGTPSEIVPVPVDAGEGGSSASNSSLKKVPSPEPENSSKGIPTSTAGQQPIQMVEINSAALQQLNLAVTPAILSVSIGNSPSCTTQGMKNDFSTSDKWVYLRVQMPHSRTGDFCRYDWISPRGTHHIKNYNISAHQATFCHAGMLPVVNGPGASNPGKWIVKFFYNNQLKLTRSFTVTATDQDATDLEMNFTSPAMRY